MIGDRKASGSALALIFLRKLPHGWGGAMLQIDASSPNCRSPPKGVDSAVLFAKLGETMRRILITVAAMFFTFAVAIPSAWAGSPHFIGNTQSASASGNTLTASGKETGLGNEAQVHIVLSATAQCINNGGKNPKAGNKTNVAGAGDFPVQNGTPTSA
jgi:hypothetical protein